MVEVKRLMPLDVIIHFIILVVGSAWLYLGFSGASESLLYILLGSFCVGESLFRFYVLYKRTK
ncbi:hypothetical protein J2R98_001313 [Alkalibacillus filiformis]|uniref:Uncharacterized protein n=1 Tax=Alkalibacillus filiformis TaxID=200990 RepID=A0ABU0DSR7_9BACI|nr:hypothetical protein [Alkalibacillus filiformis]MDQ0351499.1 hypothetical protein [Alkalibacillus filiformis]